MFDFGPDHRLNMRVGWMLSDPTAMTAYVAGYREAAEALFEHIDRSPAVPDFILFPFAFLWRHFVELSLKEIIVLGCALDGKQAPKKFHHELRGLWRDARLVIERTEPKRGDPALAIVEARVLALADIDPTSQGFRYATDTKGARSLPAAPSHVNLRLFHEAMIEVASFFEGVTSLLMEWVES